MKAAEWYTIAELKALALPDMPPSARALAYWAEQQQANNKAGDKVCKRAGRGGGFEYHVSLLPQTAQLRLQMIAKAANGEADDMARRRKALWDHFNSLPNTHKLMCEARLKAVSEVLELEAIGTGLVSAMAVVAARHDVSLATLYNWRMAVTPYDRADWKAALAPSFAATAKRSDCDERAWDFLISDFLRNERPAFSACYRRMEKAAKKEGWSPVPSERALRRRLDADVPEAVQIMAREGSDKAKKLYPAQRRDRSMLHAMQAVNMDGHKLDVFVKVPWSAKPVRLMLIGIQDLYSGKMLSWRLSEAETWEAVQLAIGDMVENFGIPEEFVLDNGRAFASKKITGGSRTRFRFKIRPDDPEGLLTTLGCNLHWTQPFSGQSKPIERAWRTVAEDISKHPFCAGAYTGNKPDAKPENYMTRAIPLADMMVHVAAQIADANAQTGRRAANCAGRSFDEAFAASLAEPSTIVKWPTPAQKSLWLLASETIRTRGSGEIHFQGNRYWNIALNAHANQKVTLRFDPDKLHQPVKVYDLSNRLICDAECVDDTGFFDQDAARLHARNRNDHQKAIKAQVEATRKMTAQQLADVLYRGEKALAPQPQKPAVTRMAGGRKGSAAAAEAVAEPEETIDFGETMGRALRMIRGGLDD